MGFALGLIAGAAKSADRMIQKDIEHSKLMTRKLASKRADREEANRLTYIKNRQKADSEIKKAVGRIGDRGADVFQFLMDKHGYEGALEILPEYEKNAKYFGDGSIANMLGLVERATGEAPTIDYLSSMAVPQPFKAQPVKTQPLSFLDKLTGRDPSSDVERMAQLQLEQSGIPAIPEGMAQIDVVGTERPDFRLRDDYSIKSQKEFITSQLAYITTQLNNEGISAEQREKLKGRKFSLQDKLGSINAVELESSGSRLDFEKEFLRLTDLADRTTDPKRKAELLKKADAVVEKAATWADLTSTRAKGSKGTYLLRIKDKIPAAAALAAHGYDVRNPNAPVVVYNPNTKKETTITGDRATTLYNTEKRNRLIKFKAQFMPDPEMLDANAKLLLQQTNMEINELSESLGLDTPPIPTDGSGAKSSDSLSVMGGQPKVNKVEPVDSPARTITAITSDIEKDMTTNSNFKNRFLRAYEQNKGKLIRAIMDNEQTKNPNATMSRDIAVMIADNLYNKYTQGITVEDDTIGADTAELRKTTQAKNMPPIGKDPTTNRPTSMIRLPTNQ